VNATHPRAVHGPDFEPGRVEGAHLFLKFIRVRKGVVAKINVARERKRELAIDKEPSGGWFVVEPMEYGFERIQASIESQHCFGGEAVIVDRHPCWWEKFAMRKGTRFGGEHPAGVSGDGNRRRRGNDLREINVRSSRHRKNSRGLR
jgi:hypothetical protein